MFFVFRAEQVEDSFVLRAIFASKNEDENTYSKTRRIIRKYKELSLSLLLYSVRSSDHSSGPKIEDSFVLCAEKVEDGWNFLKIDRLTYSKNNICRSTASKDQRTLIFEEIYYVFEEFPLLRSSRGPISILSSRWKIGPTISISEFLRGAGGHWSPSVFEQVAPKLLSVFCPIFEPFFGVEDRRWERSSGPKIEDRK